MPGNFMIRTTLPYKLDSEEGDVPQECGESLGMWVQFLKKPLTGYSCPYHIRQLGAIFPGP